MQVVRIGTTLLQLEVNYKSTLHVYSVHCTLSLSFVVQREALKVRSFEALIFVA
jgi:hypothetical protein